jgi:hypothetical protein
LSDGRVFWSGWRIAYKPTLVILPSEEKVTTLGAVNRRFAVVTDTGSVYMKNKFAPFLKEDNHSGL